MSIRSWRTDDNGAYSEASRGKILRIISIGLMVRAHDCRDTAQHFNASHRSIFVTVRVAIEVCAW